MKIRATITEDELVDGQIVVDLKANKEGLALCPVCGAELRGLGVEYFSGATIWINPDGPGCTYTTQDTESESSDLETVYCSRCS